MSQLYISKARFIPSIIFKMLKSVGFQAVDMHFHTEYSMDGAASIHSVINKCRSRGIGAAITDHNDIRGAAAAWKQRKSVFVIPGMEASTSEGVHVLYYFYDIGLCRQFFNEIIAPLKRKNPFFLPLRVDQLMERAKDYHAITCVAHPYGVGRIGIKKVKLKGGIQNIRKKFDIAEGLNGANLRKLNKKAQNWAHLMNKEMVAGSDGHLTKELGSALTLAYGYDAESYIKSAVKGHSVLLGKEMNLLVNAFRQLAKEKNYFRSARELGMGWLWVSEHAKELRKLDRKMRIGQKIAARTGFSKEAYSNYIRLRFGEIT